MAPRKSRIATQFLSHRIMAEQSAVRAVADQADWCRQQTHVSTWCRFRLPLSGPRSSPLYWLRCPAFALLASPPPAGQIDCPSGRPTKASFHDRSSWPLISPTMACPGQHAVVGTVQEQPWLQTNRIPPAPISGPRNPMARPQMLSNGRGLARSARLRATRP